MCSAQMARTQRNKATEYHLGQLKAKLAKLRTQLQEPAKVDERIRGWAMAQRVFRVVAGAWIQRH